MNNDMDYYYKKPEEISRKLLAFNGVLVALIVFMVFVISEETRKPKEVVVIEESSVSTPSPFDDLSIEAKAVYVYDLAEDKVLYRKNEFAQLPLASITKLMMALTATELLPKDSEVVIRREFLAEDGDTGLLANESWTLKDLLDFSLVTSSNDGARSIASVVGAFGLEDKDYDLGRKGFVGKMNEKAVDLGLKQTYFINENGLDQGDMSGGYGSAIDIAKLIQYMLVNHPDILEATKYQSITIDSLSNKTHTGKNTNSVVNKIPGLLASKTGYTNYAGGNLVVAFDTSIGRPIIVVVLGSSLDGRFDDVSKLVDASFKYTETLK